MIKIDLSVREALTMISNGCNLDMFEKIVTSLELALSVNQRHMVTITGGMNYDNRIPCIKAIRLHTEWELKKAKEWTDVIITGNQNTITLRGPEEAEALLRDLTSLGCEGFLS